MPAPTDLPALQMLLGHAHISWTPQGLTLSDQMLTLTVLPSSSLFNVPFPVLQTLQNTSRLIKLTAVITLFYPLHSLLPSWCCTTSALNGMVAFYFALQRAGRN